jgi:hypothetical protein
MTPNFNVRYADSTHFTETLSAPQGTLVSSYVSNSYVSNNSYHYRVNMQTYKHINVIVI